MLHPQDKLDWLREQIEMRTVGLSWTELRARWSSTLDENVGTIKQLTMHLKEVLDEERRRRCRGGKECCRARKGTHEMSASRRSV